MKGFLQANFIPSVSIDQ